MCYSPSVPTVLRINGLRVVVYPNDHRPAHVHVIGAEHEALFYPGCPEGPLSLRENFGFGSKELARIERVLMTHLELLCKAWKEIHGDY
jgi:hypothetical protein